MWVMRMLEISLLTLGDPETLTGGYLYHRRMAEAAPTHGARLSFLSIPERYLGAGALAARRLLQSAAADCDVVVLDSIVAAHVGAWPAKSVACGPPLVAMVHQPPGGIDRGRASQALLAVLDRRAYRRARTIMAASETLLEALASAGYSRQRLRLIPPGRDPVEGIEPSDTIDLAGPGARLLCVANWVPRKGIVQLLEALAQTPPGTATLHLVGRTDLDARYAKRVWRRIGTGALTGRVVVHGPLGRAQVAGCYAAADIFVLPAVREPYGTVYGEAMSSGLPVIGWRAGNLLHLAQDGREGFLVAPGDVAALAERIILLSSNASLRGTMGAAARRAASRLPTWAQTAEAFFATLAEAAE
jgi:glycosyltransferase involved in cell wall biosynthesis